MSPRGREIFGRRKGLASTSNALVEQGTSPFGEERDIHFLVLPSYFLVMICSCVTSSLMAYLHGTAGMHCDERAPCRVSPRERDPRLECPRGCDLN